MKKTVISVLIVLLLSFAFLGCGDQPCEVCGAATKAECICKAAEASNLSSAAIAALPTGIVPADILCPLGTTFFDFEFLSASNTILIYWTDANQAMYDHYKNAWLALPDRALHVGDKTAFTTATIDFSTTTGTTPSPSNIVYPEGSIIFTGLSKKN